MNPSADKMANSWLLGLSACSNLLFPYFFQSISLSPFLFVIVFRSDYDANRNSANVTVLPLLYCHHRNVTRIFFLCSFAPHSCHTLSFSLYSFNAHIQGINFDILCHRIFTVFYWALCKNVHESSLYGFAFRVFSLVRSVRNVK